MSLQLSIPLKKNTKTAPRTKSGKRRQVRQACQHCRKSHTACEEQRPCKRCVAHGLADSCVDSHTMPKNQTKFPQKRTYEEFEKVQLPTKKIANFTQSQVVKPTTSTYQQPIAIAPKKDSLNLFTSDMEELFPSLDFFSNVEVQKEYNLDELLNFDFESDYNTKITDDFLDQSFLRTLSPQKETFEFTNKTTMIDNEIKATWNLDGTIISGNESFMNLFKIPEQLVTFSAFGPHFSTIIQNEQSRKIFNSILKNRVSNYSGILEMKEFNTEFEIDSFFNQNFKCEVNLSLSYEEEKPKHLITHFKPL